MVNLLFGKIFESAGQKTKLIRKLPIDRGNNYGYQNPVPSFGNRTGLHAEVKDCGNFPPFSDRKRYILNSVIKDFKKIAHFTERRNKGQFQGGEPFIYSEPIPLLDDYLSPLSKTFQSDHVT